MSPAGAFRFLRVLSGRLLRWVLLPAAGLVLLAVVAFFLFCAFKSEMLAAALEEHLRLETGLPWKIAGPIRPVFSPLPGIRVDDVRILAASLEQEQPALFRPPLLAVRRLQIVPNLPDLFSARLRLRRVTLESLDIAFAYDKDGLPLWLPPLPPVLPESGTEDQSLPPAARTEEGDSVGRTLEAVTAFFARKEYEDLPEILIRDASFTHLDKTGDVRLSFRGLNLTFSPAVPEAMIAYDAYFSLPPAQLKAVFSGALGLEENPLRLSGRLGGTLRMTPPGSRAISAEISSLVSWEGGSPAIRLPELRVQAEGDGLDAALVVDLTQGSCSGTLAISNFSLPRWFKFARNLPPGLQALLHGLSGSMDISGTLDGIRGDNLRVRAGDLEIQGSVACPDYAAPAVETDLLVEEADLDPILPFLTVSGDAVPEPAAPVFTMPPLLPYPGLDTDSAPDVGYDVRLRLEKPRAHRLKPGPLEVRVHPLEGNVTRVAFSERKILGGELEGHLDITRRQVRMRYVLQGIGLEDLPENQGNSVRVQGRVSGSLALDIRVDEEGHWADDWHLAADAEVSPLKIIGGRKADPWWLDFPQARVKGQGLLHSVREDGITLSGDWNISLAKIRTSWFPEGQDALEGLFSGVLAWPPRPGGFVETNRGRQGVERVSGALALTGSLIVPLGSERVPLTGKMNALLDWNLFQDVVTLDQTAFEGLGGFVGGQVRVEAAGDGVTVTAPLNFKLAPRVLLKAWNLLPSGGVRMPATLTGTARVTGSGGRVTFADLALQVDGDPLEGEIVVSGGQQGPREKAAQAAGGSHWVFRLSSRRLNLDTFFPPATPEERAKPPSPEPWNLSFLGGLSLEAELSTKAAKFHGLNLADSRTVAALQRGRFSLQIETADFYGGVSTLLAQGSFVPERSQLYLSKLLGEMRGIALGRVIQDSTGADAYGGTADILFDLSGAMRSDADLYAGLSGIWSLKIADGVYPAFLGSETAGLRNTFAHASVSGAMDKGVLKADNFVLRGMMVDMSGDGWVDLGRRALDLHLNVTIAKVPTVPVRFYGSLDSPSMYLRGAHMVVDTAQAAGSTVFGLVRGILELPARALNSLISPGESGKTQ